MKIVMVSHHSCVRVHKMAIPLLKKGYDVHLVASKWVSFSDIYKSFGYWLDIEQLRELIKLHAPTTDVFHCHNEPSWFVTMIKEICDVPVVLDIHDSFAARVTDEEKTEIFEKEGKELVRLTAEERNNFQLADALVFPGKDFADIVVNEFKLTQPKIILPSYVPESLYRYNIQDWYGGLVYEGKVQLNFEARHSYGFRYCNYIELAKKCKEIGMDLHFYSREDEEFKKEYEPYAVCHDPVVYKEMIKCIARHDWGLVGNVTKTPEWNIAFPNKLFEYIAAGIPVVAINAKQCEDFLTTEGVGISVQSIEELGNRWGEHREIRKKLIKKRMKYSMDNNIEPLEKMYKELT